MSELDKLKSKLSQFGVDGEVAFEELATIIGQRVQVDARELAHEIAASMPPATVDTEAIVAQLRESMADAGGPTLDVVAVTAALDKKVEAEINSFAGAIKEKLDLIKSEGEQRIVAQVEAQLMAALNTYRKEIETVKAAAGQGGGQGNGQPTQDDRWGHAIDLLSKVIDRQDPLANIEQMSETYRRLGGMFGGGGAPDPGTVYRGNQQVFLEGLKLGAKSRGGAAPASPLLSSQHGERLTPHPGRSSRIDKVIDGL